jgi:feruloyl esterase
VRDDSRLIRPRVLSAGVLAFLAALASGCGGSNDDAPVASAEQVSCESLAGTTIAGGTVQSAAAVPAGDYTPPGQPAPIKGLPAFCRVTVKMAPSPDSNVNVEVWMPRQNWNGRFLGTGNGGGAGSIAYITGIVEGLKRGFAVANTDLGTAPDANQAIGHPERWRDFGYRVNHEMTVAGKTLATAYYQAAPRTSYFSGCSTGGQQALSIAQRYPNDYNGIVAGAPANNRTHLHTMFLSNLQALNAPGAALPQAKLNMVTSNVLAACVGKDGGAPTDTYLTDPRRCHFDPETLPKCSGADNDSCLTAPQLAALKSAWAGPINPRTGEQIFAGTPVGSESAVFGLAFQADTVTWPSQQLYMFKWALGANWNYATFDLDHDMDAVDAQLASIMNANDADLARFKAAGGKLMMFNGTADPGVPYASPIEYYERVVQAQGGDLAATQGFFRFYQVPGMGHCSSITGGPGVGDFGQSYSQFVPPDQAHDILLKLVDWVENKNAPDSIVATKYADPAGTSVAMERPICTYPKVPTYQSGDPTKASSFQCADAPRAGVPLPATRYLN